MKIQLTINENQAHTLMNALDLYSRIGIGQYESILDLPLEKELHYFGSSPDDMEVRELLDRLKCRITGFPSNASHGIRSKKIDDSFRVSWDIYQTLRHAIFWKKYPNGGIQVMFDQPMQASKESLPEVKIDGDKVEADQSRRSWKSFHEANK